MNDDRVNPMREAAAEYQLQPFKTPHSNAVLKGPEGTDVGDLDCELAADPEDGFLATVSAWDLDEEQRKRIAAGAHMRMTVWQHPIPPLALAIEAPFCPNDGVQTVYVKSEEAYCCPACDPRFPGNEAPAVDTPTPNGSSLVLPPGADPLAQAHQDFAPEEEQ